MLESKPNRLVTTDAKIFEYLYQGDIMTLTLPEGIWLKQGYPELLVIDAETVLIYVSILKPQNTPFL